MDEASNDQQDENITQLFEEVPEPVVESQINVNMYIDSSLVGLERFSNSRISDVFESAVLIKELSHDIKEDFEWFTSGEVNTESFKGQYIAIWRKQIVGNGETGDEAERMAKTYYGEDIQPALVYVPEDEDAIL